MTRDEAKLRYGRKKKPGVVERRGRLVDGQSKY
jgi:hypothetical protein